MYENLSDISEASVPDSEKTDKAQEKTVVNRDTISLIDKERIINAYLDGEDLSNVSKLLGIKYKTMRSIITRFNSTGEISRGHRGGCRKLIITEEAGKALLEFLDKNYTATLTEMKAFINQNNNLAPSLSTISNFLRNQHVTMKKVRYSVVGKNCDRVKDLRSEYVTTFLHNEYQASQCIYIDETSINTWMRRTNGRSPKGLRIYHKVETQRGPNISLVLAISNRGPVHFKAVLGSFKHESYQTFITELSSKLPGTTHYLIHDNASIHNNTISTTEAHKVINLPPYSPFLNPIETVFSVLKGRIRSRLASVDFALTNPAAKLAIIENIVKEELEGGQFQDFEGHYRHIMHFYPECILKKDIL